MSLPREASPQGTASSPSASTQQPVSLLIGDMTRAHKHKISQLKDVSEAQFRALSNSASVACQSLVESSNAEVIEIFNAESKIEQQIKDVTQQTEQLHKKMQQWAQLFVKFNRSLKEVGDVQHWSHMVEVDMVETVKILEAISLKKRQAVGLE